MNEFSRGPTKPVSRALFDPTKSIPLPPPPRVASPLPIDPPSRSQPPPPSSPARVREQPIAGPSNHGVRRNVRPESPARGPKPSRKLFDPTVHDPHQFSKPPTPVSLGPGEASGSRVSRQSETGASVKRSWPPRTAEEEADRERERRRRKEGSERGGSGISGRKKEEAGRSRGARSLGDRSSEGSESFKDRERGKGKG